MNEIANVCELVGADVDHIRKAIGSDRRIGTSFLFPGVGYGGSCFPKDTQALLKSAQDKGYDFKILRAVEAVNARQKERLVDKIEKYYPDLSGRTVAIWGLAFKPRTDDMREAPAVVLVERLLGSGAKIAVHDPEAMAEAKKIFGSRVSYHKVNYDALVGADAVVLVTEWNEFRNPDFERMKRILKSPVIFDGRNVYEPQQMAALGFTYYSMGRRTVRGDKDA
jgi:UDPglucose 6-dehydrogenase